MIQFHRGEDSRNLQQKTVCVCVFLQTEFQTDEYLGLPGAVLGRKEPQVLARVHRSVRKWGPLTETVPLASAAGDNSLLPPQEEEEEDLCFSSPTAGANVERVVQVRGGTVGASPGTS